MKQLLFLFFFLIPLSLFAQIESDESLNPTQRYIKPNEVHEKLAEYEGEFDEEITLWLSPQSAPEKFKATCVNQMILGGRFLQSKQSGYMMSTNYESLNILGYATTNQRFTLTSVNTIGTGTLTLRGFWLTPFKSIELMGDMTNPEITDVAHIRQVITFIDKDNYIIQNFDKRAEHNEYMNAEYRFKRKKP